MNDTPPPPPATTEQAAIQAAVEDLRLSDHWRYDRSRESFWYWDGHCWRDTSSHPTHLVDWFNTHRLRIGAQCEGHEDWEVDAEYFDSRRFVGDITNRLSPLWAELRLHPAIDRPSPNPPSHELNTQSGVVDLRDGSLRPADPTTSEHRAITAMHYDPQSSTAIHRACLYQVLGQSLSKADCQQYEQFLGLALTNQAPQHTAILWLYGQSGGGKTMTAELTKEALGEYASSVSAEYLASYHSGDIDARLARMLEQQPRLIISAEVTAAKAKKLNTLAGTESHDARKPYGQTITGRLHCAFWFSTTEMPRLQAGGGIKRRSKFLAYPKNIGGEGGVLPADQRINVLDPPQNLLTAILHLGIQAAQAIYQPGYTPPTGNRRTQQQALAEADPVDAWLADLDNSYAGTTLRQACHDYNEIEDAEGKHKLNTQWLGRVINQQTRWVVKREQRAGSRQRVLALRNPTLEEAQ